MNLVIVYQFFEPQLDIDRSIWRALDSVDAIDRQLEGLSTRSISVDDWLIVKNIELQLSKVVKKI